MRRAILTITLLLFALPVLAIDTGECSRLSALYEIRSLMMKRYSSSYEVGQVIDRRVAEMRRGYIVWVRRDSQAPTDKKVHKLRGGGATDRFESESEHAFAVRVVVPSKRSLFNGNNPVSVGGVTITYTVDGRMKTRTERIDTTMNPDTSRTFDLGVIAEHVQVAVDVDSRAEAVVETHYRQAVAEDDPANPQYATIQSLRRLGSSPDARVIDDEIATVERSLFPSSDPLPVLSIIQDLRRAEELIRSKKTEEQEKGDKLLKETLRRLR